MKLRLIFKMDGFLFFLTKFRRVVIQFFVVLIDVQPVYNSEIGGISDSRAFQLIK